MEYLIKFKLENVTSDENGKIFYRGIEPWMTFSVAR